MHAVGASSADFERVWDPFSSHLGLQGLACLATTSKYFRLICSEVLKHDAAQQLLRTLQAAKATAADAAIDPAPQRSVQHQPHVAIRAVHWMKRMAPNNAAAALAAKDVAGLMVWIPAVQNMHAEQLLRAGVRIRYAQLLEAANSMVPGVEVWVQVQQRLGKQTDIPAAAVAICCGSNWVSSLNTTQLLVPHQAENSRLH
jgi:hypothetical protein